MSSRNLVRKSSKLNVNIKKTTKNREAIFEFARTIWAYDPIMTLKKILKFEYAQKLLMDFLKTEYADQTLEFYLEIQNLSKLDENDRDREIIKLYQSLKSNKEKNITPDSAMRALQSESDKTLKMLAEDSFPRFLKSPFSSKLLASAETRGTEEALKVCETFNSENHTPLDVEDWLLPFIAITNSLTICITIANMTVPGAPLAFLNQQFTNLTGYGIDEVRGYNCRFLQGPETEGAAIMILRDSLSRGQDCHVKLTNYKKTGETFQNSLSLKPVYDTEGIYRLVIGVQLVILEEEESKQITQRLNLVDKLLRLLPNKINVRTKIGRGLRSTLSMRTASRAEMISRVKPESKSNITTEENQIIVTEPEPPSSSILKTKSFSKKNLLESGEITNTNTNTNKTKRNSLPSRNNSMRSINDVKTILTVSSKNLKENIQRGNEEGNNDNNGKLSDDEVSVEPFDDDKAVFTEIEQKQSKRQQPSPATKLLSSNNNNNNNNNNNEVNDAEAILSSNDKSFKYSSQINTSITTDYDNNNSNPSTIVALPIPRGYPRPNYKPAPSFIRPLGNFSTTNTATSPISIANNTISTSNSDNNSSTSISDSKKTPLYIQGGVGGEARRSTLPVIRTGIIPLITKEPRSKSNDKLDATESPQDNNNDISGYGYGEKRKEGDRKQSTSSNSRFMQIEKGNNNNNGYTNSNSPTKPVMPHPSNTVMKVQPVNLVTNATIQQLQQQEHYPQRSSSNEQNNYNSMTTTVMETNDNLSISIPSPVFILPASLRRAAPVTPQPMKYLPEFFQLSPPAEISPLQQTQPVVHSPLRNRLHISTTTSNVTTSPLPLSPNNHQSVISPENYNDDKNNNITINYISKSYQQEEQEQQKELLIPLYTNEQSNNTNEVIEEVNEDDNNNNSNNNNNNDTNSNNINIHSPTKSAVQNPVQSNIIMPIQVLTKAPVRSSQLLKRSESGRGKSAGAFSAAAVAASRFKPLSKQEDILTEEGGEEEEEEDETQSRDEEEDNS